MNDGYELVDLKINMCRWPITGHSVRYHRFCGCATRPDKVYCDAHQKLGSTPARGSHVPFKGRRSAMEKGTP